MNFDGNNAATQVLGIRTLKNVKSFHKYRPAQNGTLCRPVAVETHAGGTDFRFLSLQPDTS